MRRLVLLPPLVLSLALVVMACGGSDASAPPAGADSTTLSDGAPASVQDGDSGTVAAADVEIVPVPPHSPGLDLGSWCAEHGHTTDSIRAAAASRPTGGALSFADVTSDIGLSDIPAAAASWSPIHDDDLYPDLYVGSGTLGEVYINCVDAFVPIGLADRVVSADSERPDDAIGFVTASTLADLDRDGRTDIVVATGWAWSPDGAAITREAQVSVLFQRGELLFTEEVIWRQRDEKGIDLRTIHDDEGFVYFDTLHISTGLGTVDLDGDPCPDLYVTFIGDGVDEEQVQLEHRMNRAFRNRACLGEPGAFEDVTDDLDAALRAGGGYNCFFYAVAPGAACKRDPILLIGNENHDSFAFRYDDEGHATELAFPKLPPPAEVMGGDVRFRRDDPCRMELLMSDTARLLLVDVPLDDRPLRDVTLTLTNSAGWTTAFWGAVYFDPDNDSDEDILASSEVDPAGAQPWGLNPHNDTRIYLYMNEGIETETGEEFVYDDRSAEAGLTSKKLDYWGAYAVDYDLDGRSDVLVTSHPPELSDPEALLSPLEYGARLSLQRNQGAEGAHWIGFIPTKHDTEAVVAVHTPDHVFYRSYWKASSGISGRSGLATPVGLGRASTVTSLTVHHGDGTETTISNPPIDRYHVLAAD